MSINLNQQISQYYSVTDLQVAPEGPRAVPVILDFTQTPEYDLDLQNVMQRNFLSMVQAFYVDNFGNSASLVINIPNTNQYIYTKAGAQRYVMALCPNPARLRFISTGNVKVTVYLLNFPVTNEEWDTTLSLTGYETYSGGKIEPSLVANYTLTPQSGALLTATVSAGHAGLGYAIGDTGLVSTGDGFGQYTVLTIGAGGAVATVSVSGGNDYSTGANQATTVLTGAGNGALELTVATITPIGITASADNLITGNPGYYIGGFAVFLTSNSTLTSGTDLQVSLVDSVSGIIATINLSPANSLFSGIMGLFWNNKTADSTLSIVLSTSLSAGSLIYTIPYGLSSFVA
jgi:hypothetical protein